MKNALYAQAGGVTAVINASAAGLIETCAQHTGRIGKVYAAMHGIFGIWDEVLVDLADEAPEEIARLRYTPGGAFGSCRYDVRPYAEAPDFYRRIFDVLAAHQIAYLFYNGGNGSMDTAWQLHLAAQALGYPLISIGIPKTIDNDLRLTDCCPGYGSTAKYLATTMREVDLDLRAMAQGRPKVFVMEVMGRNAGWIAAATALAATDAGQAPHIILLPEVPFNAEALLARVDSVCRQHGYCAIVVSEGMREASGQYLSERGRSGPYVQLGGAGQAVAALIGERLGLAYHLAVVDYLQRAGRHLASRTDVEQAWAAGSAAVRYALQGLSGVMPAIRRVSDAPYRWEMTAVSLADIAQGERCLPPNFIAADGMGVTEDFLRYAEPLIEGEDPPLFSAGLPRFAALKLQPCPRRCAPPPFALRSV